MSDYRRPGEEVSPRGEDASPDSSQNIDNRPNTESEAQSHFSDDSDSTSSGYYPGEDDQPAEATHHTVVSAVRFNAGADEIERGNGTPLHPERGYSTRGMPRRLSPLKASFNPNDLMPAQPLSLPEQEDIGNDSSLLPLKGSAMNWGDLGDWADEEEDDQMRERFEKAGAQLAAEWSAVEGQEVSFEYSRSSDEESAAAVPSSAPPVPSSAPVSTQEQSIAGGEESTPEDVESSSKYRQASIASVESRAIQESSDNARAQPIKLNSDTSVDEPQSDAQLPPEQADILNPDDAVAPVSPTPSVESLETLTGLTVGEGLAVAEETLSRVQTRDTPDEAAEFLRKQRSILKISNSENKAVADIQDDLKERLDLIQAKMYQYRGQRDHWRDQFSIAQDNFRGAHKWFTEERERAASFYQEKEALERDNSDIGQQLEHVAEEKHSLREHIKKISRELNDAIEEKKAFEEFAAHEQELATCELKRRKLAEMNKEYVDSLANQTMRRFADPSNSAQTDTHDLPGQASTGPTDESVGTPEPMSAPEEQASSTRRARIPSTITGYFMDHVPAEGTFFQAGAIRWSEADLARLVPFMTTWINRHEWRGRQDLTEVLVREIIGDGTLSYWKFVEQLEQAGFIFRPDRLARQLSGDEPRKNHGLPAPNAEVIFAALNRKCDQEPVPTLAHRISDILFQRDEYYRDQVIPLLARNEGLQEDLSRQAAQLEDDGKELEELEASRQKVERQRRQFEAELRLSEVTLREVLDNSETHSQRILQLQDDLKECRKHGSELQAAHDRLVSLLKGTPSAEGSLQAKPSAVKKPENVPVNADTTKKSFISLVLKDARPTGVARPSPQPPEAPAVSEAPDAHSSSTGSATPHGDAVKGPTPVQPSRPQAWIEREQRMRARASYKAKAQKLEEQRNAEKAAHEQEIQRLRQWREWAKVPGEMQYVPKGKRWAGFTGSEEL